MPAVAGFEFTDEAFTVTVETPEGFDQAVRRAVRKCVARAGEWNAENPDASVPRLWRPRTRIALLWFV